MRKNNLQLEAITPSRTGLEAKSLHTPVNSKDPAWSPILHAETPNLNVSIENLERTPALLKSLGILVEDANVSWSSCMATPSSEVVSPNVTVYHTPIHLEGKSKVFPNCQLFHTSERVSNSKLNPAEICQNYPFVNEDSLRDRPASKFVYPKPVYIEIENVNNQMPVGWDPLKDQEKPALEFTSYSDEESAPSPVLTIRRRIRKSLKFNYESYGESSGDQTSQSRSPAKSLPQEEMKVAMTENRDVPISFNGIDFKLLTNDPKLSIDVDGNSRKQFKNIESTTQFQLGKDTYDCLTTTESKNAAESINSLPNQKKPAPSSFKLECKNMALNTGFSTASGKNVVMSSEALARANSFFEDFVEKHSESANELERMDIFPISALMPSEFVKQQEGVDLSNCNTDVNVEWKRTEFSTPKKDMSFSSNENATRIQSLSGEVGFCTATGKAVSISEQALTRAKALFESDQSSPKTDHINPIAGFSTAGGKRVTVSKNSISRGEQMFQDTKPTTDPVGNVGMLETMNNRIGFSTAAGKAVLISEQALTRAKALFESDHLPGADDVNSATGSTNFVKYAAVSEKSLSIAKPLIEETRLDGGSYPVRNIPTKSGIGFSTAAGKAVSISEQALTRAKALFESEQTDRLSSKTDVTNSAARFSTASGKHVMPSDNSLSRAKALFEETKLNAGPDPLGNVTSKSAVGFSTAAGKALLISDRALIRAKALFESEQSSSITDGANAVAGFSTARGGNLTTSEKSPSRSHASFQETRLATVPPDSARPGSLSKQSTFCEEDSGEESYRRKRKMEDEDSCDDWASSPTIGKKKRKDSPSIVSVSSESLLTQTPSSAFDCDPTSVSYSVLSRRKQARSAQKSTVEAKKKRTFRIVPKAGSLYLSTKSCASRRKNWVEFVGQISLPETCPADQLLAKGVTASVCLVNSANAASFTFYGWECFSVEACRNNSQGFQLGEYLLIMADNNTISCEEIGDSLMALESVDPSLISPEWVRNHFRWIVWKLACMEVRLPDRFAQQCLTPQNVLDQLKYRYDREIDRCERSALRRIIEQDDAAAKTLIVCVAGIDEATSVLELTDGWYGITARCDAAFKQLIADGKIFIGVKLIISGAELISPGPTSPLEIDSGTYLKISANSCRRARWHSRLGFYKKPLPILVSLRSILPEGGLISHLKVMIARVYPLVYMGKTADGKTQFRSERCYRKESESAAVLYERMMEKMMEDVEREEENKNRKIDSAVRLTDEEKRDKMVAEVQKRMGKCTSNPKATEWIPLLKLRVVDENCSDSNSAILSVWRPTEDVQQCLKENQSYHLYHVSASGIRFGELQLNSMKQTRWQAIKNGRVHDLERSVTSFQTANQSGFKPPFNELDVVGLVVFVAQQPNKNSFQTAVLSDGINYFGIKCWVSFDDYALTNVIVTGSFLSFSNLQWRSLASKDLKIPFAFVHEGTLVSSRPAQKHLQSALNDLKRILSDPGECISQAALHVNNFFGNIAPNSIPRRLSADDRKGMYTPTCSNEGKSTPSSATASNPSGCRTRLLEKYGTPPSLSPWIPTPSPDVRHKFKPPAKAGDK